MHVVLAWFADRPQVAESVSRGRQRMSAALSSVVPAAYLRHEFGGDDWGLTVLHSPDQGAWRWQPLAEDAGVRAVSMGVPVGLDASDGPVMMARRLLNGEDIHAGVVPPFGLMAFENDHRFVIQQDWLGMCRLFIGEQGAVTAVSNRPTLVARFLNGEVRPDYDGWGAYATCGHFGGELSPVRGVRQLAPGARLTGHRRDGGGWGVSVQTRFCVDDVVRAGIEARGKGVDDALDLAAAGLADTAASVDKLYGGDINLGLSGGKDSRLIAASLIAGGRMPKFHTNEDLASESEVARQLMTILRERRGLNPEHRTQLVGSTTVIESVGLYNRIQRLQSFYDYQFPSNYSMRSAAWTHLPVEASTATFSGAGGELATGFWYPERPNLDSQRRSVADAAIEESLLVTGSSTAVAAPVFARERARIAALLDRAEAIGLRGLELVDYAYLMERVRRWYSSAYSIGMVTPFLEPSFVSASFAVTPQQKMSRFIHVGLIERLLPEWKGVPFASGTSQQSTAVRISDGDGLPVIHGLLDTVHGDLANLLRRDEVEAALAGCIRGQGTSRMQKILRQFAYLAVASEALEPERVRPASTTYAEYEEATRRNTPKWQAGEVLPGPLSALARRVAFVKRSRLGGAIWAATRHGLVRARRRR